MSEALLPCLVDIEDAARRLAGFAVATPLLESTAVNLRLGGRLLLKAESLQRTGSFKFRGAYNALSQLGEAERRGGVVAFSSGNHAQGVAAAAQLLQMPALIVMPADAPRIKVTNTRDYGAEIVFYDRQTDDREAIAAKIAGERGALLLPPFDHPQVIAGQGTIGLEIARDCTALGAKLDAVIAPCSGGGLIAGCALAIAGRSSGIKIYAAEPEGFDDLHRSLVAGRVMRNTPGGRSICDSLLASEPGVLPFAIAQKSLAGSIAVSDAEIAEAMAMAFNSFKLVVEPGGAAGLAAVLSGKLPIRDRTVAVVASGGNVDLDTFTAILARRATVPEQAQPA